MSSPQGELTYILQCSILNKYYLGVDMKKKAKDKPHYVDNKKFLQAMIDWRETWPDEDNIPPVTNYIGECFLKIATHLSYRPNFINYTYRDEMISDGIENCLQYVKNFNPEKSKNPFAYFTQMIYYAFLRRIEREKKQAFIKFKLMEENDDGTFSKWFKENYFDKDSNKSEEDVEDYFSLTKTDLEKFSSKKSKKKAK